MTLDGFCDHTGIIPDEEIHQHYADLLYSAGLILYGSVTFQLMKYWQTLVINPSGEKSMDDFAIAMDKIPKIVFSHKLKNTEWDSAEHANLPIEEMVKQLKRQSGGNILVGSRSLIIQLMELNLIDEYQFCVHPVVAGKGLFLMLMKLCKKLFSREQQKSILLKTMIMVTDKECSKTLLGIIGKYRKKYKRTNAI